MALDIVYHDDWLIAINKPSGLLVHRSPIDRHETRFAVQLLRDQIGQRVYPVHRLDKPTSGILLFALQPDDARRVHQQFSEQQVDKQYLAVCRGHTPPHSRIDHPVRSVADHYADSDGEQRRPAVTELATLAHTEIAEPVGKYPSSRYSLVQLKPLTGRRHQLRAHMKHIAHPIIGDAKYGRGEHNRFFRQYFNSQRLLLAAWSLSFRHPHLQQTVRIVARPGADFCDTLAQLGFIDALPAEIRDAP